MTTKAHVKDEWERNMVGIAVVRNDGTRQEVLQWEAVAVETREAEASYRVEEERDRLHLPEDVARAIYEALADHFGHSGHDTRALRRDYEAERKRVDLFIAQAVKR
jgi:hypothetical protein